MSWEKQWIPLMSCISFLSPYCTGKAALKVHRIEDKPPGLFLMWFLPILTIICIAVEFKTRRQVVFGLLVWKFSWSTAIFNSNLLNEILPVSTQYNYGLTLVFRDFKYCLRACACRTYSSEHPPHCRVFIHHWKPYSTNLFCFVDELD